MSTLQQRPHGIGVGSAPQPDEAGGGEGDRGQGSQAPGNRPAQAWNAGALLRYGSLAVLAFVLLAGYWKPHPLPSLVLPAAALLWWWPTIRGRHTERWLYFYIAGIYLYTVLRAFADDSGMQIRAEYVIAIDRFMFLGNVPSVELQQTFFRPWDIGFLDFLAVAMHWSFFVVPHAVFAYLWFRQRSLAPVYAGAVLVTLYLGLLLFWLVPTVPPWLAARQGELGPTYRVMNFVTSGLDADAYRDLYATLAAPNPVASVPSIHMALTFLVLLAARELAPRWVAPVLLYNLAMGFSLVYLGEHYVFDLLVGVVVASIAHFALRSRYARPTPGAPPDRGLLVPVPVRARS
ncbi:MAG: phosphatase PAP2 family protein [Dehalococcoidia bacterium]